MLGKTTRGALHVLAFSISCAAPATLAATLDGCSSSGATAATPGPDAAPDADTDVAEAGTTAEAGPAEAEAAAMCDVGAMPALPALTGEVIIEGADGGSAPAPTGGDEDGLWTYQKIFVYLPAAATGQIDPAASSIAGKGFIELKDGSFRQFVDTTTILSTSIIGKVTRAGSTKVLGTYAVAGTVVAFTVTCRESTGQASSLSDVAFSRIDATHGRLHVTSQTQVGTTKLVIDLERQP